MALAYGTEPTKLIVTLRDEAKNQTTKTFVVPTSVWNPASALWADLVTIRDGLITALNAITDGLIWKASIMIGQSEDTSDKGAAGSEVENLASLVCVLATLGKTAVVQIPAPVIGVFMGTDGKPKNVVDPNDADLLTFIAEFQTTGGNFVLSDGEFINDTDPIDSGKRIHRKSRKG